MTRSWGRGTVGPWDRARPAAPAALALAVVLGAAVPRCLGATAQSPAERARLDSIRASFRPVSDTAALIRREQERIAVARVERDDPMIHMELGYLSFRLGELTGAKKRYEDAASEFQWAADLRPQWPYAWYWLGMSELETGESSVILIENLRQILGQDRMGLAARALARAAAVDPSFAPALVDLAVTAMRQRLNARLAVALGALRQSAGTAAGREPTVLLWRGRLERRLDEPDSALAAFRGFLAAGGDSAVGLIEVARTQAQLGRLDSTRLAYAAAIRRPLHDSARREAWKDLRWIATPLELEDYGEAGADSAGAWLARFWEERDLEDGRRSGERMFEQFRRYEYAVRNFARLTRRRSHDVAVAYRDTSQSEFDDRGVVYLRHGSPTVRAQYTAPGYDPNESWLYRREAETSDLVVHFVAVDDVQDFRLVESLLAACRVRGRDLLVRSTTDSSASARLCVQSRANFSALYDRLSRPGGDSPQLWAEERQFTLRQVRTATTTDSYALAFPFPLEPVLSWFAVGDAARRPELHLVFAVPASRLHPIESADYTAYQLALRVQVTDSTGRLVATADTLRAFRSAARLAAGQYLTERIALAVPAGPLKASVVVEEPHSEGTGSAVTGQAIAVPAFDAGFSASDMVLGRDGSGLAWRRAEGTVPLNPLSRFPQDGTATLWYELYGLPQGSAVETRVRIVPRGGRSVFRRVLGGGSRADLAYTTVTDAEGLSRVRQTLELRGLRTGRYTLEVEFTDPGSGNAVRRSVPFEIEGR